MEHVCKSHTVEILESAPSVDPMSLALCGLAIVVDAVWMFNQHQINVVRAQRIEL